MVITSKMVLRLTAFRKEADGKEIRETIILKPGKHNYPSVDHKDPRVAEQLRVIRKHGRIEFAELLPSDVELMKKVKGNAEEKAAALKAATTLKPPKPVARVQKQISGKRSESPNRKAVRHAARAGADERSVPVAEPDADTGKGGRKVSDKK